MTQQRPYSSELYMKLADNKFETYQYLSKFHVNYEYPIVYTKDLFHQKNKIFVEILNTGMELINAHKEPSRIVIFIDNGVVRSTPGIIAKINNYCKCYSSVLSLLSDPIEVEGGESCKNDISLVPYYQQQLIELGIDRHSYAVAIGGGAVVDLIGYVAATTHRGVRLIRVPTTTLSQGDGAIGVKNGINSFGVKNVLGTFCPPVAVINDVKFLKTLLPRDLRSGIAEAVKVALIKDSGFFDWIEKYADEIADGNYFFIEKAISRSAELHIEQITKGGDPFERGAVRPLDYGHWSAHKLEILSKHALNHGEAVAIGIALDTRYAIQMKILSPEIGIKIFQVLKRLGFDLWHQSLNIMNEKETPMVLEGIEEFREHMGGVLTIVLLKDIGQVIEVNNMYNCEILSSIEWLGKEHKNI